jgi:hypothetical protein
LGVRQDHHPPRILINSYFCGSESGALLDFVKVKSQPAKFAKNSAVASQIWV